MSETTPEIIEANRDQGYSLVRASQPNEEIRIQNMLYTNIAMGFVWMLFHFTVVYFFTITLESVLLVGIFLALGNAISLVLDVPVGILQRYFPARKLFIFGALSQFLCALVFLKFIFAVTLDPASIPLVSSAVTSDTIPVGTHLFKNLLDFFLNDVTNILLLIVASFLYGFTKEINDVTSYAYIMNTVDPNNYASVISKMNIYFGAGSLFGLLLSGVVLSFAQFIAVSILVICVALYLTLLLKYFDRSDITLDPQTIKNVSVMIKSIDKEKAQTYMSGLVSLENFGKVANSAKTLFLKPVGPETNTKKLSISQLISDTKAEFVRVKTTLMSPPLNLFLIWSFLIIMLFGAWDTFASSFLLDFLAGFAPNFHYILLACIAIPAYLTQSIFIKLSGKIGVFATISFGLILGIISMLGFVFIIPDPETLNATAKSATDIITDIPSALPWQAIGMLLLFGVVNSLGYAASMSLAQEGFLTSYNTTYAEKLHLTEIDANASSAPMKIVQNLANVFGLILGGVLLAIMGYKYFFALFGLLILSALIVTIKWRKNLLFE